MQTTPIVDRRISIGVLVLGILVLALGIYILVAVQYSAAHPARAYSAIGLGFVLLIAGCTGLFLKRHA